MQRLAIFLAVFSSFVLFRADAVAEHAPVGVAITCSCPDEMGSAYVAAVKDLLSKDAHFKQMDLREAAGKDAIRVHIISMPLDTQNGQPRSVLSIVVTHDGALMHQFIETCAHIPILDCAQSMLRGLREFED